MSQQPSAGAVGWTMFAGIMLILIGFFHAIAGFAGILKDEFYAVTPNYILKFDATTWGWIHLIGGVIVAARRLRGVQGRGLGSDGGRHRRSRQRRRELRVAPGVSHLGDRRHRDRRGRHLGPHRARSRHHDDAVGSRGSKKE